MAAVNHRLTVDDIVAEVQEHILAGIFAPGERLGEADLAQRFGVSRGPVRDALRKLAGVGLVTQSTNVGVRVREFSLAEAKAFYQLREALEGQVARLAAEAADPDAFRKIELLLKEHVQFIHVHPEQAYLQRDKDRDFHLVLSDIAGNPLIHNLLTEELYPQLVLLRQSHQLVKGRGAQAFLEHQRIAEAVYAKDGELASLLMRRHIQASWESFHSAQQHAR